MTSTRSYRKALTLETALQILEQGSGTQFDSTLVSHMRKLGRAGDLTHIIGHSADGIPVVACPHCGPVIAIPRSIQDGDVIYVTFDEIFMDAIKRLLGYLCPAGVVQKDGWAIEGRELAADGGQVEGH